MNAAPLPQPHASQIPGPSRAPHEHHQVWAGVTAETAALPRAQQGAREGDWQVGGRGGGGEVEVEGRGGEKVGRGRGGEVEGRRRSSIFAIIA